MKTTELLLYVLLALFAWSNLHRLPPEYQFWRHNETSIKVVNNSDQDITEVTVVVWSAPHKIGTIKKGASYELTPHRQRDLAEIVIRFRYGNDLIERYAGTLDEDDNYRMMITVNYAGVVTVLEGSDMPEAVATKP